MILNLVVVLRINVVAADAIIVAISARIRKGE